MITSFSIDFAYMDIPVGYHTIKTIQMQSFRAFFPEIQAIRLGQPEYMQQKGCRHTTGNPPAQILPKI